MLCAMLLRSGDAAKPPGRIARGFEAGFARVLKTYERSLDWALSARLLVLLSLVVIVVLHVYLFIAVPKGFFPQQDPGGIMGGLRADTSISFQAMSPQLTAIGVTHPKDPAVEPVN